MKRKRHILLPILIVCLLAPMVSASVIGGPKYDEFGAMLEGDNILRDGWGTGWNGGEWNLYPQAPTVPSAWWNQWFYDDKPDWNRRKHIKYFYNILPLDLDTALANYNINVGMALNWSNMEYPETGPDGSPPMADEEYWIERYITLYSDDFIPGQIYEYQGEYDIWDYNPEWVSIDVWVKAFGWDAAGNEYPVQVSIDGWIEHECIIPEPASLALLGFGTLALLKKKK